MLATLAPWAVGAGVTAVTGTAAYKEWEKRKRRIVVLKEDAQKVIEFRSQLPEGCLWVQQGFIPPPLDRETGEPMSVTGTTMLACNGTYGVNRGLDILIALDRAGLADYIVSVLFWDCSVATRKRIEARLPPAYRDRTIFAGAPDFPDGFGNMSPEEVEEHFGKWSVPLEQAIEAVVALHQRRAKAKPGDIINPTSLGGHAKCEEFIAQKLKELLPETPIIGVVNLPKKEVQRDYFAELKPLYDQAGVDSWIVSDQMESEWQELDEVTAHIVLGIATASLRSPTSPRLNNIAKNATSKRRGGIARYEYITGEVVAHRLPADPTEELVGYYVYRDQVESELGTLIEYVEKEDTIVSLDMPVGEEKRMVYDLALAALHPNDMRDVSEYIEEQRKSADENLKTPRPHLHPQPNYDCIYTVWAPPIDPEHPRCQLIVIRIRPVTEAHERLSEIVKVPSKRGNQDAGATPVAPKVPPAPVFPHTNGVVVMADDRDKF